MPPYAYTAVDERGKECRGEIEAPTPFDARSRIRDQGFKPIKLRELTKSTSGAPRFVSSFRRPELSSQVRHAINAGLEDMVTLLGAAVPLEEAIRVTARQVKSPRASRVFQGLADEVANGESLSDAMGMSNWPFGTMCCSLVASGQESGSLERAIRQYLAIKDRWSKLRSKVLGAMMYPMMVFGTGIGVVVFLSTFVLPAIVDVLEDSGGQLPWMTRVVIAFSGLLTNWWWLVILVLVAGIFAVRTLRKHESVRRPASWCLLKFPLIGVMTKNQHIAHTCALLSGLLKSGMQLVEALRLTSDATGNILLKEDLDRAVRAIENGEDPGEALKGNMLPEVIAHVFVVAQSPERVEELLDRLAADYDQRLDQSLNRFVTLFEPIMILVLASVV
ncbi:MAG: type II secretion system F family protein, partial [Phycisphaerales bacterium]|nr:type II secretion system F family protein [Phycisphaerales bacterium]